MMIFTALGVVLAVTHFAVPLLYFIYLKKIVRGSWNLSTNIQIKPRISIILPIFDESAIIRKRLDDIHHQTYPKDLIEVIIVDSGKDGTEEIVSDWTKMNPDLNLKYISETTRSGKLNALLLAMKEVSPDCDVVIFTDADVFWEETAIAKAVNYLADHKVGAVTASICYSDFNDEILENVYRSYYNFVRVAESKIHSTPVHNGPFLAIRAELLRKFGLPLFEGSDDSSFGSFIAFSGYRAISVDDILIREQVRGSQTKRKVRRAQHLLLNFLTTKRYTKKRAVYTKTAFDKIWKIEWWLHVVSPWLLVGSALLLIIASACSLSLIGLTSVAIGFALLLLRPYRMWITQQIYLVTAAVRNLWNKDIMWKR